MEISKMFNQISSSILTNALINNVQTQNITYIKVTYTVTSHNDALCERVVLLLIVLLCRSQESDTNVLMLTIVQ